MTPRPDVGRVAAELYAQFAPTYAGDDEGTTWPLLHLVTAACAPLDEVDGLAADAPDRPGWSTLFDPDAIPEKGLRWLSQLTGGHVPSGLDGDALRQFVRDAPYRRRGGLEYIRAAVRPFLTGTQRVEAYGNDGGNRFAILVVTYESETPDPATITRVLLDPLFGVKPAGYKLTYRVDASRSVGDVEATYATVGDVEAAYATVGGVERDDLGA